MDDIEPNEAVRLSRVLFPGAFKILAYRPAVREARRMNGDAVVERIDAVVMVQLAPTPRDGFTLNNPQGRGPSLREAVAALTRCPFLIDNEAREKVLLAVACDDYEAGVLSFYSTAGVDVPVDNAEK